MNNNQISKLNTYNWKIYYKDKQTSLKCLGRAFSLFSPLLAVT